MESQEMTFDKNQYHLDKLEIENEKLKIELQLNELKSSRDFPDKAAILEEVLETLGNILFDLKEDANPKTILEKGLLHLDEVNQKRFILENFLEGIKRTENPKTLVENYRNLGLMRKEEIQLGNQQPELSTPGRAGSQENPSKKEKQETIPPPSPPSPPPDNNPGLGEWLMNIIKGPLRRVVVRLMSIITNALGAIPSFVAIEPIVGMTGIFPSLSFKFKTDSVDLRELFMILAGKE